MQLSAVMNYYIPTVFRAKRKRFFIVLFMYFKMKALLPTTNNCTEFPPMVYMIHSFAYHNHNVSKKCIFIYILSNNTYIIHVCYYTPYLWKIIWKYCIFSFSSGQHLYNRVFSGVLIFLFNDYINISNIIYSIPSFEIGTLLNHAISMVNY